jgi:putative toxin-antitoxin system antitoxin component (TIGR02293 family)
MAVSTESLLGGTPTERDPLKLMRTLGAGLPISALKRFKQETALTDEQLAGLLHVGARTLTRLKSVRRLPADLSDRLYALATLYALAEEVLGSRDAAIAWLNQPQYGLEYQVPRQFLATELGREQVKALLNRIKYGFLA